MNDKYLDIIDLPYQKSKSHKHMANHDRASQFAPFAALTGYESLIKESQRYVEEKIEISDDKAFEISNKLSVISSLKDNDKLIKITFFQKDDKKSGGKYITVSDTKIILDEYNKKIIFDNNSIDVTDIYSIESDLFLYL